jgi:hypothetical protein
MSRLIFRFPAASAVVLVLACVALFAAMAWALTFDYGRADTSRWGQQDVKGERPCLPYELGDCPRPAPLPGHLPRSAAG